MLMLLHQKLKALNLSICFARHVMNMQKKSVLQALPLAAQRGTSGDERTCPVCKTKVAVARNPQWKPSTERRW